MTSSRSRLTRSGWRRFFWGGKRGWPQPRGPRGPSRGDKPEQGGDCVRTTARKRCAAGAGPALMTGGAARASLAHVPARESGQVSGISARAFTASAQPLKSLRVDLLWTCESIARCGVGRLYHVTACNCWWKGRDSNPRPRHYEVRRREERRAVTTSCVVRRSAFGRLWPDVFHWMPVEGPQKVAHRFVHQLSASP